ncbi:DUF397 domain-containing protein [Streptomyces longisporoflavus]|uniref:DUF397 domain-containing protein n=1 Tax=Streptomyces longisporoflavus TaxID=28044 RepID=A0ABW7QYW2_9ACTN
MPGGTPAPCSSTCFTRTRGTAMPNLDWQKSTFSEAGGDNCLYVSATCDGAVHIRESDAPCTVLTTDSAALAALIQRAKESV